MADVHFVVGPPGGTQRLPGHKVSNSCMIGSGGGEPEGAPTVIVGQSMGGSALLGQAAVCVWKGYMQWDNLSLAFLCGFG